MALLKRRRLHTHGNDNFSLYTLANKPHCIFLRSLNLKCAAWHICDPTVPWSPLVRCCGSARRVGNFSTERCHASDHKWQFSLGYGLSWHPLPTTSVCSCPYSRLLSLTLESSKQAGVRAVHRSYVGYTRNVSLWDQTPAASLSASQYRFAGPGHDELCMTRTRQLGERERTTEGSGEKVESMRAITRNGWVSLRMGGEMLGGRGLWSCTSAGECCEKRLRKATQVLFRDGHSVS